MCALVLVYVAVFVYDLCVGIFHDWMFSVSVCCFHYYSLRFAFCVCFVIITYSL